MVMNHEEALKALRIGAAALESGDHAKAIRFIQKSLSMHETPEAKALLAKAQAGSNGPVKRPAATASHKPPKAKVTEPQRDSRPFTPEQAAEVKRINSQKDLYSVLGLARNADENQIKKAYKKMAIKVHPDKNSAPGSDEAFKQVSRAFSILSDPQKKAAYDQYGDDSDAPNAGVQRRYYQEEFDPADIFNQVFGAGFTPGARVYTFGPGGFRQAGGRHHHQTTDAETRNSFLQLLPLLILLAMSLFNFPSTPKAVFSLHKSGRYDVERTTDRMNNVVPGIPYFVESDFRLTYGRDRRKLQYVENEVQQLHFKRMFESCNDDRKKMTERSRKARRDGNDKEADRILSLSSKNCEELERLNTYILP